MDIPSLLVGGALGAALGYVGRWAQIRWLEEPSEQRKAAREQRRQAMSAAATLIRPAMGPLRELRGGVAIEADKEGARDWWRPTQAILSEYRGKFEHEWLTELGDVHDVDMATAKLLGAENAVYDSMIQHHPAHVLTRRIGDLSDAVEALHKTLTQHARVSDGRR